MGGRGAYWNGSSKNDTTREFDSVGKIGNIKVLKVRKNIKNITLPQYSNTKNTTYFSANQNGEIKSIGFYKNHALVESIDITSMGIHSHRWVDSEKNRHGVTTKSRHKIDKELSITSDRHKRLIQKAINWNGGK